jgi:Flp pilus assembly protein TadB
MTSTVFFGLLGAGTGLGMWLIVAGWRGTTAGRQRWRLHQFWQRDPRRVAVAVGAGVAGGVLTGWAVGAVLTAAAAWSLPRLLAREKDHERQLTRIQALAGWAELMRDTLAAATGLEQAILVSARVAPKAIRNDVTTLAKRLETGHRLAPSLQQLSDELADPTADLMISALRLAATRQARNLSDLLGSLAAAARELASMRQRIETSRARTRASVRIIVGTTCGFAAALIALNRDYVSAYDTVTGQLVLLGLGAVFAVGFVGLAKIAAVNEPARFLALESGRTR